jgi:uncharacterized protein Yka (UPF0111/DUF47 family)
MGLFNRHTDQDNFILQLKSQAERTVSFVGFLESQMSSITGETTQKGEILLEELVEIRRIMMDDLQNTFITPIDREDIYHISTSLFGMAKYTQTTLEEMRLLQVQPDRFIVEMVGIVKAEATELLQAINRLMKNPRISYEHLVKVSQLEAKADRTYREAVKALLEDKERLKKELQGVLHIREVYRHISNMSDKAEAAADALGMAVIKLS